MPPRRSARSKKFVSAGWPHIPDLKGGEQRPLPPGAPLTRTPGPYAPLPDGATLPQRIVHITEHLTGPCPGCNDAIALIRELASRSVRDAPPSESEPFATSAPSRLSEPGSESAPIDMSGRPADMLESAVIEEQAISEESTEHTERLYS